MTPPHAEITDKMEKPTTECVIFSLASRARTHTRMKQFLFNFLIDVWLSFLSFFQFPLHRLISCSHSIQWFFYPRCRNGGSGGNRTNGRSRG